MDATTPVEDDELNDLTSWGLFALACWLSVEIVNAVLQDPIGGYHRWIEMGGNGNYRPKGQWFFMIAGLWLYIGAPYLAVRLSVRAWRAEPSRARLAGFIIAAFLLGVFVRLIAMEFATGAISWT